jgi:serine/threonine protein kinase
MPAQRMKVDISKLALNLDGCRFGSPPAIDKPEQQQQRHDHDSKQSRRRRQLLTNSSNYSDHDDNIDDNDGDDNDKLSPLSTYHLNHRAQYNPHKNKNNHHHHHSSQYHNDLTSPLGTTYRREGLSIGHNFLRFQGSTLSDNFNSNQLDVLECIGRGVCSSVWKARRKQTSGGVIRLQKQAEKMCSSKQPLEQQHQEEKEYYALKIFSMRDPQKRTMLIRELKLLCSTNTTSVNNNNNSSNANNNNNNTSFSQQQQQGQECECLVELEGAFLDEMDGTVTLVLEYMNFGSLADLLSTPPSSSSSTTTPLSFDSGGGGVSKNNRMPEYAIASIAYQMIWGLGYLHHEGVLHRDIKPANVLLSKEGRVKLADFGIVSNNNNSNNYRNSYNDHNNNDGVGGGAIDSDAMNITMIGTTRYMSPERLHGQPYNQQADIWSLGLILLECTRGGGNSPFEHISSIVELVQTLDDCTGGTMEEYIPHDTSMGLTEILLGCLNHCPEKRIPADVLIGSPWFELHGIECVDDAVVGMKRYLETL